MPRCDLPVGVPRRVEGYRCRVYPGEQAVATPQLRRHPTLPRAQQYVVVWDVTPARGWRAAWRRLRYRLVGRFLSPPAFRSFTVTEAAPHAESP